MVGEWPSKTREAPQVPRRRACPHDAKGEAVPWIAPSRTREALQVPGQQSLTTGWQGRGDPLGQSQRDIYVVSIFY
jgi:hypothetical protein